MQILVPVCIHVFIGRRLLLHIDGLYDKVTV